MPDLPVDRSSTLGAWLLPLDARRRPARPDQPHNVELRYGFEWLAWRDFGVEWVQYGRVGHRFWY